MYPRVVQELSRGLRILTWSKNPHVVQESSRGPRMNSYLENNQELSLSQDYLMLRPVKSVPIAQMVSELESESSGRCSIHSSSELMGVHYMDRRHAQVATMDFGGVLFMGFGICGAARSSDQGA